MKKLGISLACLFLVFTTHTRAELPTAEAYVNSAGVEVSLYPGENINLFTGSVTWREVDAVIPGHGGLDLVLSRSYNARGERKWKFDIPEFDVDLKTESVEDGQEPVPIIRQGNERGGVLHLAGQDPIIMIDPGQRAINYDSYSYASVSKRWVGKFISKDENPGTRFSDDAANSTYTYKFYAPNGLTYDITQTYSLDKGEVVLTNVNAVVKDASGNRITYTLSGTTISISANDGRSATVNLAEVGDGREGMTYNYQPRKRKVLDRLVVHDAQQGNRVWDYQFDNHKDDPFWCSNIGDRDHRRDCDRATPPYIPWDFRLTKVVYPTNETQSYIYRYRTSDIDIHLDRVVTKEGSTIDYGMSYRAYGQSTARLMISSRQVRGGNIPTSDWAYSYTLASQGEDHPVVSKRTKVTGPANISVTDFHENISPNYGIWGEMKTRKIYSLDDTSLTSPIRTYAYYYDTSSQPNSLGASIDNSGRHYRKHLYFAPLKRTVIDGKYQTEYSGLDSQWNWKTKSENTGTNTRVTQYTYFNQMPNSSRNFFVGLLKTQTISGNGKSWTTANTYNTKGQLTQSIEQGIQNDYEYDANGNLSKHTYYNHAGTHEVTFSSYKRGQAQTETYPATDSGPDGFTVTREINDAGTVAWEEDGEGNRTSFKYDALNRVTKITPEGLNATNIIYEFGSNGNFVRITRDNSTYQKEITLDKLSRKILTKEWGNSITPIYENYAYDSAGRQTFVSQPSLSATETNGLETTYDALSRVLTETDTSIDTVIQRYFYDLTDDHVCINAGITNCFTPGSGDCSFFDPEVCFEIDTTGFDKIDVVMDGRDNIWYYKKRGFGGPDATWNAQIEQPEGIVTDINRNVLGDVESVSQGGVTRTYSYDTYTAQDSEGNSLTYNTQRLYQITEPERDTVTHSYDAGGNLLTRQVGSAPKATYRYDALNRLALIDYDDDDTADISYSYWNNGSLKSMINGVVKRSYNYTTFGALDDESLEVGPENESESFTLDYGYNADGFLDALSYPSSISLSYTVDDFGRITKVGTATQDFVTDVTYHPNSTIHEMTFGNGVKTTYQLNSRQMVKRITAQKGIEDRLKMGFSYDAVTNVSAITDYMDSTNSISMTYDGVNRLKTANGLKWGDAIFNYDDKGNITLKDMGSLGSLSYSYNATTNRLDAVSGIESRNFSYDPFGNATSNGQHDFVYNAASRLVQVLDPVSGNPLIDYTYDGDGIKALEIKEDSALYTFYSQAGDLLYEKDFISDIESTYIQLGNQNIAKINTGCIGTDTDLDGIDDCTETKLGLDPNDPADAAQDRDGDGLSNAEEIALGTNLDSADSDGDGMPDKWEVDMQLNPLEDDADLDTDGDGFTNLEEFQNGTSPQEPFNFSYVLPAILHVILN